MSFFNVTSWREMRALSALAMMVLAPFLLLDLAGAGKQRVEIAELFQQLRRRLRSDAGHARHVVDESPVIACRSIIFSGGTPHFSITSGMPICLSFIVSYMRPSAPTSCIRSLSEEMMVVSRAGLTGQPRIGGDQVVGLKAFLLDARQVEGLGRLADQPELRDQVFRRRRAVCLVFGVEFVAEGFRRIVEDDGEMCRHHTDIGVARILHQLPQHVAETGHSADRQTVRFAVERRQRVIGAEDIAGAVDEEEMIAFFHGGRDSASAAARSMAKAPVLTGSGNTLTELGADGPGAHAFVTKM